MLSPPAPIDPRGPRFNQAVLAGALLLGFAFDARWVVPVFALVLLAGAAFGPRYGPFLRLYAELIKPRLGPPAELEDPRPPRFAAAVGVAFLLAGTVAFGFGAAGVGWGLALVVAALAALSAVTGICVGCEIWVLLARGRGGMDTSATVPDELRDGAVRTWVVFTSPYCASCRPLADLLRRRDPAARVVTVDVAEAAALARSFDVRSAPTTVLADGDGRVVGRFVGAAAVQSYLAASATQPGGSSR